MKIRGGGGQCDPYGGFSVDYTDYTEFCDNLYNLGKLEHDHNDKLLEG